MGVVYLAMQEYRSLYPATGPFNSEFTLDLKDRAVTAQRRWYDVSAFILDHQHAPTVTKRAINEEPEPFHPATRMTFTRWGVPFEIDIACDRVVARYDRKKVEAVFAAGKDLNALFAEAEIARTKGDVKGAVRSYEACKPLLPSEEQDFRRNVNLRLYPLYMELSRWGHQAVDFTLLEDACRNMGATASNPEQEIRALLAYSELHKKRGEYGKAAQVLRNASRHYWREPFAVSRLESGDRAATVKKAEAMLGNLLGQIPSLYASQAEQMAKWERAALQDYFLSVAEVDRDSVIETRTCIAQRLRDMLALAPPSYRKRYDEEAAEELKLYDSSEVGERLRWRLRGGGGTAAVVLAGGCVSKGEGVRTDSEERRNAAGGAPREIVAARRHGPGVRIGGRPCSL